MRRIGKLGISKRKIKNILNSVVFWQSKVCANLFWNVTKLRELMVCCYV